jgi:hypothetical protein
VTFWANQTALFQKARGVDGHINHVLANASVAKNKSIVEDEVDEHGMLNATNLLTYNVNLIGCMYSICLGVFYLKRSGKGRSAVLTDSVSSMSPLACLIDTMLTGFEGFSAVDYCEP